MAAPKFEKVQLDCIDREYADKSEEDLYREFVAPKLQQLSADGKKKLVYFVSRNELFTTDESNAPDAPGPRFIISAVEPDAPAGILHANTAVHVRHDDTPVFSKIHLCPYDDSLPSAYSYDLFEYYIRPFFAERPGDVEEKNPQRKF